ncbi:hypothetical protein BU14_0424s0020, partial [Porphyra umbilicalis]
EDLALRRSWAHCSKSVQGMNITVFWEKTADTLKTQPEVFRARSAASLWSRWSVLQRIVQKYLSADNLYRISIPSGEVEEDTKQATRSPPPSCHPYCPKR